MFNGKIEVNKSLHVLIEKYKIIILIFILQIITFV